jgi:DNA polymerase-3 subunit delta'
VSDDIDIPHPRATLSFYGHAEPEQAFLEAYRAGRMPHAWLIGGARGIGKATLAYRMARYVFAHPTPSTTQKFAQNTPSTADNTALNAGDFAQNANLALPPDHPVVRRIAAQGHPDLLALERVADEKGKVPMFIPVDMVRKTIGFFGSTAGEGGWRVCIVDSADELNAAGANALLKILEEPPAKSLLLVVSHAPGRLLPTIRSRCRRLMLRPLDPADVARAAAETLGRDAGDAEIKAAAAASEGSVARALGLLAGTALAVRERVDAMLAALPAVNPRDLHALGDALGRDETAFTAFVDAVRDWLSARITVAGAEPRRLDRMAEVWERLNITARDVTDYNLERKPLVFNVFDWLAAATRG